MTLDLDAIKMRAEAATLGPWKWDDKGQTDEEGEAGAIVGQDGALVVSAYNYHCCDFPDTPTISEEDRAFITHAREDIPQLMAEVERLRSEVEWRRTDAALATDACWADEARKANHL